MIIDLAVEGIILQADPIKTEDRSTSEPLECSTQRISAHQGTEKKEKASRGRRGAFPRETGGRLSLSARSCGRARYRPVTLRIAGSRLRARTESAAADWSAGGVIAGALTCSTLPADRRPAARDNTVIRRACAPRADPAGGMHHNDGRRSHNICRPSVRSSLFSFSCHSPAPARPLDSLLHVLRFLGAALHRPPASVVIGILASRTLRSAAWQRPGPLFERAAASCPAIRDFNRLLLRRCERRPSLP